MVYCILTAEVPSAASTETGKIAAVTTAVGSMTTMRRFLIALSFLAQAAAFHAALKTCRVLSFLKAGPNWQPDVGISIANRRDILNLASAGVLSSLLIGQPSFALADDSNPQLFVITGANSGIGFEACKRLAQQGHTIVMACRTAAKAQASVDKLQGFGGNLIPAECDLASLKSVLAFSNKLPSLVDNAKIDALCLNAGLARNTGATDVARTADGFELTVGTNHFGHFYLQHLLLPQVNPSGGRIVITASGVHDPESPGGAQGEKAGLGDLTGLEQSGKNCEMIDGAPFNADKAYKDSKLCNVLFTRELQRRLLDNTATKGIIANCFNPGLIVGTGLFRDQNPLFTKVFDFAATDLLKVGEVPTWGGGALVYTTSVNTQGLFYSSAPGSSKYGDAAFGKEFAPSQISTEAQDNAKAKRLWELSAKELGISA